MQKEKNCYGIVLALCTVVFCAAVLYSLRYSYLSCSDSVCEFVYGRIYDFGYAFKRSLDFCLQRGRFGLIFPFVVAIRYKLLGSGSTVVFWAVQYIPILVNVALLSVILGRRAGAKCGILFTLLFFSLLQVNGWHSLITCYPLDFMYGLTLAVTGLLTFANSLKKKSIPLKVLSAFLFYESMQTYEAFLTLAAVYLFIALISLKKENRLSVKNLAGALAAHILTGILFVAMRVFVMIHPIVPLQEGVEDLSKLGNPKGFVMTLGVFSGGMFPLADLVHPRVRAYIAGSGFEIKEIVLALVAGIGCFAFMKGSKEDKEAAAKVKILGICGLIGALVFPLIHSLTAVYQSWVVEGHQFGYVPTTISYFGWIVFICCAVSYLPLSGKIKGKTAPVIAGVVLFALALVTCGINSALREKKIGPTSTAYAYKTQEFYAVARDGYCGSQGYDYILATGFDGVHDSMMFHEIMLERESSVPYEVTVTSSGDEFMSTAFSFANPAVIFYDEDSDVAIITDCDGLMQGRIASADDIRVISAHGGEYTLYYDEEGVRVSFDISLNPGEGVTIDNDVLVDTSTIDVVSR